MFAHPPTSLATSMAPSHLHTSFAPPMTTSTSSVTYGHTLHQPSIPVGFVTDAGVQPYPNTVATRTTSPQPTITAIINTTPSLPTPVDTSLANSATNAIKTSPKVNSSTISTSATPSSTSLETPPVTPSPSTAPSSTTTTTTTTTATSTTKSRRSRAAQQQAASSTESASTPTVTTRERKSDRHSERESRTHSDRHESRASERAAERERERDRSDRSERSDRNSSTASSVETPSVDKQKKRLLRKAELARASRRRKKAYVGDLEEKCSQLVAQNGYLIQLLNRLPSHQLRDVIDSTPGRLPAGLSLDRTTNGHISLRCLIELRKETEVSDGDTPNPDVDGEGEGEGEGDEHSIETDEEERHSHTPTHVHSTRASARQQSRQLQQATKGLENITTNDTTSSQSQSTGLARPISHTDLSLLAQATEVAPFGVPMSSSNYALTRLPNASTPMEAIQQCPQKDLVVKASFRNEWKRFTLPASMITQPNLALTLSSIFVMPSNSTERLRIRYLDADGDEISLASTYDLIEAARWIDASNAGVLKLHLALDGEEESKQSVPKAASTPSSNQLKRKSEYHSSDDCESTVEHKSSFSRSGSPNSPKRIKLEPNGFVMVDVKTGSNNIDAQ